MLRFFADGECEDGAQRDPDRGQFQARTTLLWLAIATEEKSAHQHLALGASMTDDLATMVDRLVADAIDAAPTERLAVRRSTIAQDLLVYFDLDGREPHRLSIRITDSGVLLDLDGSQALEFAAADERDMHDLARVVREYARGELEVLVGVRDGEYYALRTSAGQLYFPQSALAALRPARKEWRPVN